MRLLALLPLLAFGGCVTLSWRKPPSLEQSLKERRLRDYYVDVQTAFARGDAKALAGLFDPDITKPMTQAQILAWGEKFFGEHGPARFRVEKLDILELGWRHALTRLSYRVETRSGQGDFSGTELDTFTLRAGRWRVAAWEKVSP